MKSNGKEDHFALTIPAGKTYIIFEDDHVRENKEFRLGVLAGFSKWL